ncbi:MAG TPA: M48 family metallopeptidase [Methylomirabilota bacterium]|jgi:heat shock protein HtpX|nr:M48 family metallopeptidase [Methylomirabilota bacterium]
MAADETARPAAPGPPPPAPGGSNLFDEQRRNRRATWLLIAGFVALLAFIGFGFDLFVLGAAGVVRAGRVPLPLPIAASGAGLLGIGSAWLGYRFGDRAVLASSFARPVTADDVSPEVKRLMNVVTEMAIAAGLPMPRVHLIDEPDPNAFATGRDPEHASIAVTTGLVETMNREELQGVVAHEMAHVRNLDIRTMTLVAALLGALLLLSDWATRLRLGLPDSRDAKRRDGAPIGGPLAVALLAVWLLTVLLTPLIGRLLATAVSRRREYLADASGAELTRNPLGLASALRKLEAATAPTARIHRGTAHLCIADPLGRAVNEREGWLADLFATHPPIADRVGRLEAMAYRRQT